MDDTLDMSKAVVTPVSHPEAGPNLGWDEENVPAMFRPLLSSPKAGLGLTSGWPTVKQLKYWD